MTTRREMLGRGAPGLALMVAGLGAGSARAAIRTVYVVAEVPPDTGTVWITGNSPVLGPWRANGAEMYEDGNRRIYALRARDGFVFEYKFTKGSWETEALGEDGQPQTENHRLTVGEREIYLHAIPGFKGG